MTAPASRLLLFAAASLYRQAFHHPPRCLFGPADLVHATRGEPVPTDEDELLTYRASTIGSLKTLLPSCRQGCGWGRQTSIVRHWTFGGIQRATPPLCAHTHAPQPPARNSASCRPVIVCGVQACGPAAPSIARLCEEWEWQAGYTLPGPPSHLLSVRMDEDPDAPAVEVPLCCLLTSSGLKASDLSPALHAATAARLHGACGFLFAHGRGAGRWSGAGRSACRRPGNCTGPALV